jgi:hypothetical protein
MAIRIWFCVVWYGVMITEAETYDTFRGSTAGGAYGAATEIISYVV